ncbi:unnamed protein product [Ectocarpus sp. 4 AP-2014]
MAAMIKAMDKPSKTGPCFLNPALNTVVYDGWDLAQDQQGDAHLVLIKLPDAFSEASEGDEGVGADMLKKAIGDMTPVVASEHVCSCGHVSTPEPP